VRTIAQPERLGRARLAGRHACCYQLDRAVPLGTGDAAALSALVSAPRPPLGVLAATRVTAIRIATLLYESSTSSGNLPATHPLNGHRVAQMIPRLLPSACMSASNTFDANLVGAGRNALIAASYRSAKGRGGCLLDRSRTPGGWVHREELRRWADDGVHRFRSRTTFRSEIPNDSTG
jgi:hypothetical protein